MFISVPLSIPLSPSHPPACSTVHHHINLKSPEHTLSVSELLFQNFLNISAMQRSPLV